MQTAKIKIQFQNQGDLNILCTVYESALAHKDDYLLPVEMTDVSSVGEQCL